MVAVVQDASAFFTLLLQNYNIQMIEKSRSPIGIYYVGECFSNSGEKYGIGIYVKVNTTEIKVYKLVPNSKVCVFQKSYSTVNDKQSLSKSVSLIKFLDKTLFS